mgnify:CR=1 FL=1|jgi:hypothetical protein|tara:strand:+ start:2098 stop:2322 length:225 start_codon:yes stop_codon:yes gene_type:complete
MTNKYTEVIKAKDIKTFWINTDQDFDNLGLEIVINRKNFVIGSELAGEVIKHLTKRMDDAYNKSEEIAKILGNK